MSNKTNMVESDVEDLKGLVEKIVEGRVIVYVGAGVSQSSNLPSWDKLLKTLQDQAAGQLTKEGKVSEDYFARIRTRARNLEIGDWLKDVLEDDFHTTIKDLFSKFENGAAPTPSSVHRNLVRLPFSMTITTNYDLLLENAYEERHKRLSSLTWEDATDIMRAIKSREHCIVHAHGVISRSASIILSGSQYTKLANSRPNFGEILKWLFQTKTFLFIGSGLEDPDLIFHMQAAIAAFGIEAVGQHYALLPYDQAPDRRCKLLKESLNLKVIRVGSAEEEIADVTKTTWITNAVSRKLRDLSGSVALQQFASLSGIPTSDDRYFCLKKTLRKLLELAIDVTGSYRGDFCFPSDIFGSHLSKGLRYSISEGPTAPSLRSKKVRADSICGITYYQGSSENGLYIPNVDPRKISEDPSIGPYSKVEYVSGDENVQSEFAIPVVAGGVRVGVLNLESNLIDAYSNNHRETIRKFAEKAGRLFATARERQQRGMRLGTHNIELAYKDIKPIYEELWHVARDRYTEEVTLGFLVYKVDYYNGELVAQDPNVTVLLGTATRMDRPRFSFHDQQSGNHSLATSVFLEGRPYSYPDIGRAIRSGKISNRYHEKLKIKGPIIGFPVLVRGHIVGVIAVWHCDGSAMPLDGRDIELFRRVSHLLANDRQFQAIKPARRESKSKALVHTPAASSFRKINNILTCIRKQRVDSKKFNDDEFLNDVGTYYRDKIGASLNAFLKVMAKQEERFLRGIESLGGTATPPKRWISPKRCRCWVRSELVGGEPSKVQKPTFLLGIEISINSDNPYRNVVEWDQRKGTRIGIGTQPFVRQPADDVSGGQSHEEPTGRNVPEESRMRVATDTSWEDEVLLYDGDIHLSFLLAHVSAYPFSFQQKPWVVGRDMMSRVLQKDPDMPWFVVPLIVGKGGEWSDTDGGSKTSGAADGGLSEMNLAGYLTFDNGACSAGPTVQHPADKDEDDTEEEGDIENAQRWIEFQNDLLHQIALFGACLAQKNCFKRLVPLYPKP